MKAIQYQAYGSYEENRLVEVDRPKPKDGEVLVKMSTVGINPLDNCEPLEPEVSNPTLEDKVRREILAACQRANWKLGGPRGAAARLGLKRTTLFYKMKRLGIAPPADHWQD